MQTRGVGNANILTFVTSNDCRPFEILMNDENTITNHPFFKNIS